MYHVCTAHPLCTTLPRRTADLMRTGLHSSCTNSTTSSRLHGVCNGLPPHTPQQCTDPVPRRVQLCAAYLWESLVVYGLTL